MIETVVALLMFWDGEIKEHRIQESMAECLRARRVAERELIQTYLTNAYVLKQKQKSTWVKRVSRNFTSNEQAQQKRNPVAKQLDI